jgi:tRNA (guanine-N(7)-)-methyltransferase
MAAPGRPTRTDRFEDRLPDEPEDPDFNPYLVKHREFGFPLLPASEAQKWAYRWDELFGRPGPLHLEIGSGNGEFMVELARRNPSWNLVGIEIRLKRTVLCAKKIRAAGLTNVVIARYHASFLHDLLLPGSLAGMWVNHPDPWPKERHDKNRLISRWFLEDVATYLRPGAFLRLKSDFAPNCDRVAELLAHGPDGEPLPALPLAITGRSVDIARDGAPWDGDILTNYQGKMLKKGVPVHGLEVVRTA